MGGIVTSNVLSFGQLVIDGSGGWALPVKRITGPLAVVTPSAATDLTKVPYGVPANSTPIQVGFFVTPSKQLVNIDATVIAEASYTWRQIETGFGGWSMSGNSGRHLRLSRGSVART